MDKNTSQKIEKREIEEEQILYANLIAEKVKTYKPEDEYKRILHWLFPLFVIVMVASFIGNYLSHKYFISTNNQINPTLESVLQGENVYQSSDTNTIIFEKNGTIYAIGNLTKKEKVLSNIHYQNRMNERGKQIETKLQREHELKLAIERTKTAKFLNSGKTVIVRPEYIAKRIVKEKIEEPTPEIVEEIIEEVKEKIEPVIVAPKPIIVEEPKNNKPITPPGQINNPNSNKPETPPGKDEDKTPPGQDKPDNPNKGKGKEK